VAFNSIEMVISNPAVPAILEKVEFLLDSGAIHAVVPTLILEKLGIQPFAEQPYRLIDGTQIMRKKGVVLLRYGERTGASDVIFGEEGDQTLIGALALGSLGLGLHPLTRELMEIPMMIAGVRMDEFFITKP